MTRLVHDPVTGQQSTLWSQGDWGGSPGANTNPLTSTNQGDVIHYSVTNRPGSIVEARMQMAAIDSMHRRQGRQPNTAYTATASQGQVFMGRGFERVGAHTVGLNATSRGFCWLGGADGKPPRREDLLALLWLIRTSRRQPVGHHPQTTTTHGQHNATSCAGPHINPWVANGLWIASPAGGSRPKPPPRPQQGHSWRHYNGAILSRNLVAQRRNDVAEVQFSVNIGLGANQSLWTAVDGHYGPDTERAVRLYQRRHREFFNDSQLAVDGIFGPITAGRLSTVLGWRASNT